MQIILLIIPAVLLLALIIFFALSRESNRGVKRAAIAALILIVLSVGVSILLILSRDGGSPGPFIIPLPVRPSEQAASNVQELLIFFVILMAILALILFFAFRDRRRQRQRDAKIAPLKIPDYPEYPGEEE